MKLQLLFLGLTFICSAVLGKAADNDLCKKEIKCVQTEYAEYIKCLGKQRQKRDLCPYTNSIAPHIVQAIPIQTGCAGMSCQPAVQMIQEAPCLPPACSSESCVNTCTATCGGYGCNDRCQQSCQPAQVIQPVQPVQPIQNTRTVVQKEVSHATAQSPNVTTIIKLTNIVNNTNVVNVPTTINNTNINNLEMGSNSSSQQAMQSDKCCMVVEPKRCEKIAPDDGIRCIHRRHHTCGEQCQAPVVHAQVRQPCSGNTEACPPAVAYVPQPQPRCSYQPSWPYVNCGTSSENTQCNGCYDHYGYGFQAYHGSQQPSCGGCYDDNYQAGSLYRQGPVYQPGYYHAPPVYTPQPVAYSSCGMVGCFGNQFIDPAYGVPSFSPYSPYTMPYYPMPMYVPPSYYPPTQYNPYDEMFELNQNEVVPVNTSQIYPYSPQIPYGQAPIPVPMAVSRSFPYSFQPLPYWSYPGRPNNMTIVEVDRKK